MIGNENSSILLTLQQNMYLVTSSTFIECQNTKQLLQFESTLKKNNYMNLETDVQFYQLLCHVFGYTMQDVPSVKTTSF